MSTERQKEIRRRRKRKRRIGTLKRQLAEAKTLKDKERIIELIRRRHPFFDPKDQD